MPKQRTKTLPAKMTRAKGIVIPKTLLRSIRVFDPSAFLSQAGLGRKIVNFKKGQIVFSQGEPAESVFYIQSARSSCA
jgi:CRP-like cAMP-binding protein